MPNTQVNTSPVPGSPDWLASLVGRPYKSEARGPHAFDCWGLVVYTYSQVLGINLPNFFGFSTLKQYTEKMGEEIFKTSHWVEITDPKPYCVVAMSQRRSIHHVGFWVPNSGGRVFHAMDGAAVVADTIQGLKARGIRKILFLEYNNG